MPEMNIGSIAYLAGLGAAVLAALVPGVVSGLPVATILLVAGLVAGFLNVTEKEGTKLLLALIAMPFVATSLAGVPSIGGALQVLIQNVTAFTAAAAAVIVVKVVMETLKK